MDILYQYYSNTLTQIGVSEFCGLILWYIFSFLFAVFAFFIISNIIMFIDNKLTGLINLKNTSINEVNAIEKFKNNNPSFVMIFAPTLFLWGLVPYSNKYIPVPSEVSLLLFMTILCFLFFAFLFFAEVGNKKNKAIEAASNFLQVILPMLFSVLGIIFLTSSLNLNEIILYQSIIQNTTGWLITPAVFGFFIFVLGIVSILSLLEKQLKISSLSLFNITYPKIKLLILSYYSLIFMSSVFSVCLFLGGYLPPLGFYLSEVYQINYVLNTSAVYFEQIFWLILKSLILSVIIIGLKTQMKKIEERKIINILWYILFPLSIINILVCMIVPLFGGH